eukprot:TRINITY_DN56101_c0_g1_i3.p1 TRINITY_DN56101_c0_g1~~TRINITY_DN56101_c0_g1_i3.p1  ORF type:complete len:347 (-),score=85.54 TRINITY_DN56101_c0_g1_i3:59-1099(-)
MLPSLAGARKAPRLQRPSQYLRQVGAKDLFKILNIAKSQEDYRAGLYAMNLLYNFGVKLKHREIASRLLACAMACEQYEEAVELVQLSGTWLEHPPDTALVYSVMGHFLDAGQPLVVRELAKAVREDWRMKVEPPLYILAIQAMLSLPEDQRPLQEAMVLYEDAHHMGVRLPAAVHVKLLDTCLEAVEADLDADSPEDGEEATPAAQADAESLMAALRVADGLCRDGHLLGGANSATCLSMAWLFLRTPEAMAAKIRGGDLPHGTDAFQFLDGSWTRAFEAAVANFGNHWGFSSNLPSGFFKAVEALAQPSEEKPPCGESARLVAVAKIRFGRFYPAIDAEAAASD